MGIPFIDLYKDDACKPKFDEAIRGVNPVLITGTGHGNETLFTAQGYDKLLQKGKVEDAQLIYGRWLSLLSCRFGNSFDWWIEKGVSGMFGYTRDFYFVGSEYPNSVAVLFFDAHHSWDIGWMTMKTTEEVWAWNTQVWNRHISEAKPEVARYLVWDRDSRVFKGDWKTTPFSGVPPPPPKYKIKITGVNKESFWGRIQGKVLIEGEAELERI